MENNSIFRKSAVDRVSSPEQLNEYIHVTSPSIWVALIGIIFVLVGAIVWATFGNIYTTVYGAGVVKDKNLVIYVNTTDRSSVKVGMDVTANGHKTTVRKISAEPVKVSAEVSDYILEEAKLKEGDWAYVVEADTDLEDGVYQVSIVVETIHPIKFVTN